MKNKLVAVSAAALAAAVLRAVQWRTGFDEAGLAVMGNLPGVLLPAVLLLTAAYAVFSARKLPAKRGEAGDLAGGFCFAGNMPAVLCAVAGVFLVVFGAALRLLGGAALADFLLGVFAVVAALCVLYAVFALYRGNEVQGVALLVPVCCLVVYMIFLYRSDASDPVLARIYIEILAVAFLTYAALERAAFAFRAGSPRACRIAGAMACVLAAAAAGEFKSPAATLLFGGCALTELGFLCAEKFEKH